MLTIAVLHGPNLNLLGQREPEIYGRDTLEDINSALAERAGALGARCTFFQSNCEGELVTAIQRAGAQADGILLNAAAYTHTSVALRDAISAISAPCVEVHLSNTAAREAFRRQSYLSAVCLGTVCGFGAYSYQAALDGLIHHLKQSSF